MHVPIQVDYGVRALIDLAERYANGETPVRTSAIAHRQGGARSPSSHGSCCDCAREGWS